MSRQIILKIFLIKENSRAKEASSQPRWLSWDRSNPWNKSAGLLDIGAERFSNSESPCRPDASHQVSALPDLLFGRRCGLKNFKMAAIMDIETEQF